MLFLRQRFQTCWFFLLFCPRGLFYLLYLGLHFGEGPNSPPPANFSRVEKSPYGCVDYQWLHPVIFFQKTKCCGCGKEFFQGILCWRAYVSAGSGDFMIDPWMRDAPKVYYRNPFFASYLDYSVSLLAYPT